MGYLPTSIVAHNASSSGFEMDAAIRNRPYSSDKTNA